MRPLSSHQLVLGKSNENLAAQALFPFLKSHSRDVLPRSMHFRGLVCKRREPWVASSVDGLLVFFSVPEDVERVGCVEIKTMTTKGSMQKAKERAERAGSYCFVDLSSIHANRDPSEQEKLALRIFHETVPSVSYRAQLLHHAATFGVPEVFYCVADLT